MKSVLKYDDAIDLINEEGFLFLLKSKKGYLSLEDVAKGLPWYSDLEHDPWRWKCRIANEKKAAYTRLFGKRHMFISWDWYPYYLSYFRNGWSKDDFFENGYLSRYAKDIYELLETEKILPSHEIRKLIGADEEKTKFENALTELQAKLLITICGESKKLNKKGQPYGWSVVNFALTDEWVDEEIRKKAQSISFAEAKEEIYAHIREKQGELSDKEVARFIGIKLEADWK